MVVSMKRNDVASIRGGLGHVTISCDSGLIWVTVAGDAQDHILSRGEELRVPGRGKVVIMAQDRSKIRVYRPVTARSFFRSEMNVIPACEGDREVASC